jgi:hypothetical protein
MPNAFKLLLQRKAEAQKAGRKSVLSNQDLAGQFAAGEKPQPKIRRGGRNGSGKP